ncbi:hypothetical protein OQA88_7459 [Cercophora sp. LCS_1]
MAPRAHGKSARWVDYCNHTWAEGDIAFLRHEDEFSEEEYRELRAPTPGNPRGYVHAGATGHPVIVVSRPSPTSTHVAITPVSAYSSSADNNFLAPWKQWCHRFKNPLDFRSFEGTELAPSTPYRSLTLLDDKSMPKPEASWVYLQSVWVVPVTVLKGFTKSRQGLLRVSPDSMKSLRESMGRRCRTWTDVTRRLAPAPAKPKVTVPTGAANGTPSLPAAQSPPSQVTPRQPALTSLSSAPRLLWSQVASKGCAGAVIQGR